MRLTQYCFLHISLQNKYSHLSVFIHCYFAVFAFHILGPIFIYLTQTLSSSLGILPTVPNGQNGPAHKTQSEKTNELSQGVSVYIFQITLGVLSTPCKILVEPKTAPHTQREQPNAGSNVSACVVDSDRHHPG